jgi:hypothetical protein
MWILLNCAIGGPLRRYQALGRKSAFEEAKVREKSVKIFFGIIVKGGKHEDQFSVISL